MSVGSPEDLQVFEFVVWFEDPGLPVDDEDHEWVAVYRVTASSIQLAAGWGELVAEQYAASISNRVLLSSTAPVPAGDGSAAPIPTLLFGRDGSEVAFG